MTIHRRHLLIVIVQIIIVLECSSDNPVITEQIKGHCYGQVSDSNSKRVSGARVLLLSDQYTPSDMYGNYFFDSTETDQNGNYSFKTANSGYYNVIASSNNLIAMHNAIQIDPDSITKIADLTLSEPGSLSGTIHLQYMADHQKTIILFKGINRYTEPVDSSGYFTVSDLAPGSYHLKCISIDPGFSAAETTVTVISNANTTLPLIEIESKASRKVKNFKVEYDAALKIAHLSWDVSFDTASLSNFNIYLNRTHNYKPFMKVGNTVSKTDVDLIGVLCESFLFSITTVDTSNFEGPDIGTASFKKESSIEFVKSVSVPLEYTIGGVPFIPYVKIDNNSNLYLCTNQEIIKYDSNGVKTASFKLSETDMLPYDKLYGADLMPYGSFQTDQLGNAYALLQYCDSSCGEKIIKFDNTLKIIGELSLKKDVDYFYNSGISFILKNDETLQLLIASEPNYGNRLISVHNFDFSLNLLNQDTVNRYISFNYALSYNNNLIISKGGTSYYDKYLNQIYSLGNDSLISLYFSSTDTNHNQNCYIFSDVNSKMILILPRPLMPNTIYQKTNEVLTYRNLLFINHKYEVISRFQTEFTNDQINTHQINERFQIDDFGNFYVLTMCEIDGKMTLEYKKYHSETLSSACKNYSFQ